MAERLNPKGELICCIECGRDTRSKSGVCVICLGCTSRKKHDRKGSISATTVGGSAMPEINDDGEYIEDDNED